MAGTLLVGHSFEEVSGTSIPKLVQLVSTLCQGFRSIFFPYLEWRGEGGGVCNV